MARQFELKPNLPLFPNRYSSIETPSKILNARQFELNLLAFISESALAQTMFQIETISMIR